MQSINEWDSNLYDDKHHFVSQFGNGVLKLLNAKKEEKILDLGCGTGDLTYEISKSGAEVKGMDLSESMIHKAREKYPDLKFSVDNAATFQTNECYDVVFSNAALHWIKNAPNVVSAISQSLTSGGRFVAEFGGKGNVGQIMKTIKTVLNQRYGINAEKLDPFYFPSIGEYTSLLEAHGFRVTYCIHFERPTPLEDGERGLVHWLDIFSDDFFQHFTPSEKQDAYVEIVDILKPKLFKNHSWIADYKRIRVMAIKE
ncbi:class I SAM-dependent methyltransferase [Chengkuizengella axinellae]|uniref:Methyltransferase domain-containing protein n=1 Tax=Chengkuizengella axinellae TaxID=3064388 RepID=A0ABT9IY55_9BACL|nr:class I SAM-dependent methyltransferase [Chengkuizengella sp. 2205SS18-9]MDP5274294.1 methyltransferase domain-containing protein [Chengkuizengella sp. 2205SS18-9]